MATINFPSSPTLNDQYSFEGKTWTFNGDGWVLTSTPTTIRIDSAYGHANAAFAYANTLAGGTSTDGWARETANLAYDQANTATVLAQAAFDTANSGGGATTDSWARDTANAASSYANGAFSTANTAETLAQASFDYANTIVTDTKLTVASVNESNVFSNIITNVTTLGFDTFTGFHVTDLGSGNVKISLGSTFSVWNVPGQDDLTAVGDDTIRILSANGISISTNNSSTPKEISFDGSIIFDQANAAFEAANNATDSWVRDAANSAGVYANAAYDAANAAYALAQSGGTPLSGQFDYGLIIDATSTIQDYGTL